MEVRELQEKILHHIESWEKYRGTHSNEQQTFNHIVEEIGELAREYVNKDSRKEDFSEEKLENAIGDSIMQLIKLAKLRGLDAEDIITKILREDAPPNR